MTQSVSWRENVTKRLLQYTFVGDIFKVADDPLGPPLEEFLQKEECLGAMQPRPQAKPSVGALAARAIPPRAATQAERRLHPASREPLWALGFLSSPTPHPGTSFHECSRNFLRWPRELVQRKSS